MLLIARAAEAADGCRRPALPPGSRRSTTDIIQTELLCRLFAAASTSQDCREHSAVRLFYRINPYHFAYTVLIGTLNSTISVFRQFLPSAAVLLTYM